MLNAKSRYLENALLDHVLRNTAYSPPAAVYLAAYTVAPTKTTAGTEVVTTGGTLYARTAVTFSAASGGATSNTGDVLFPVAGVSWGTIVAVALVDNATAGAGNILYYDDGITPVAISAADQLKFPIGDVDASET
jgi:hypothetical protein